MAVLADILPVVSRSSALALKLYGVAVESPEAAKDLVAVANKTNGFAAILKQLGTIIKEDDRLPSPEVRKDARVALQLRESMAYSKIGVLYCHNPKKTLGIPLICSVRSRELKTLDKEERMLMLR